MDSIFPANICPNCGCNGPYVFHRVADVPVNSCLLYENRKGALDLPSGNIDLSFCPDCNFVYNAAWRPERSTYNENYEETQEFSGTFSAYQKQQAMDLLARHGVHGKEIVEIGCGKGEFLSLLCELGGNRGIGYDPSFVPSRRNSSPSSIEFKRELFTSSTSQSPPDLVCCKMTLEHISETGEFVRNIRRIASIERGTVVFIQVPDIRRILAETAFWDVYYEHCSYFSPASLERVLHDAGFDVLRVGNEFGGQYLTIEARVARAPAVPGSVEADPSADLQSAVARYSENATRSVVKWKELLRQAARMRKRTVLWGSGSKAVAFLSAVGANAEVEYLIDVNPYRWGKFVPGSGKQIMPPEVVLKAPPDLVIVMNPNYLEEISGALLGLGCSSATLLALGRELPHALPDTMEGPRTSWTDAHSAAS